MGSGKKSSHRKSRDRRKKRSRTPSSQYSSSQSDRSSEHRRSKKIKKSSSKKRQKQRDRQRERQPQPQSIFPPPPPTPYIFNPYMAPPPPAPPVPASTSKINKAKQFNIFKILPQLGWSSIMFCNTIIDPELFGHQNYDQMISKMWKRLERRMKMINLPGTERLLRKVIPEGMAEHERIGTRIREKAQIKVMEEEKGQEPVFKYSDFDILKAYYDKKPMEEIRKMIGPENTVKFQQD